MECVASLIRALRARNSFSAIEIPVGVRKFISFYIKQTKMLHNA